MANRISRPAGLNVGLTDVGRWRKSDEVHLPDGGRAAPVFLPQVAALDGILKRETLDERLASDVVPEDISPDLLMPAVLTATRKRLRDRMLRRAAALPEPERSTVLAGAALLDTEVALDAEIQEALATLLKG